MKKVTLLIFLCILFTASCTKDKYCWTCITGVYVTGQGSANSDPVNLCNKTQKEIDEYIKSTSKRSTVDGISYIQRTQCRK